MIVEHKIPNISIWMRPCVESEILGTLDPHQPEC